MGKSYDTLEDSRRRLQAEIPAGRRGRVARIFKARYDHLRRLGSSHEDATVGAMLFVSGDGWKNWARDVIRAFQRLLAAENAARS